MGTKVRIYPMALLCLLWLVTGCSEQDDVPYLDNIDALKSYAANPEHGLVRSHVYAELAWKVQLVPRECEEMEKGELRVGSLGVGKGNGESAASDRRSQLRMENSGVESGELNVERKEVGIGTLHFLITISTGAAYAHGDVMMAGVANYDEYADRMIQMNFRLEEGARLHLGGTTLIPKLCYMENTFGLTYDRKIHLWFADDALVPDVRSLPKLDLVIEDWIFDTGISHYVFHEKDLQQIPRLRN